MEKVESALRQVTIQPDLVQVSVAWSDWEFCHSPWMRCLSIAKVLSGISSGFPKRWPQLIHDPWWKRGTMWKVSRPRSQVSQENLGEKLITFSEGKSDERSHWVQWQTEKWDLGSLCIPENTVENRSLSINHHELRSVICWKTYLAFNR